MSLNSVFKELYVDEIEEKSPMPPVKKFKPGDKIILTFPDSTDIANGYKKDNVYEIEKLSWIDRISLKQTYTTKEIPRYCIHEGSFIIYEEKQEEPVKKIVNNWGNW